MTTSRPRCRSMSSIRSQVRHPLTVRREPSSGNLFLELSVKVRYRRVAGRAELRGIRGWRRYQQRGPLVGDGVALSQSSAPIGD